MPIAHVTSQDSTITPGVTGAAIRSNRAKTPSKSITGLIDYRII